MTHSEIRRLEQQGYVVLRAKSHRAALERKRIAEALLRCAEERIVATQEWARAAFDEQRRLADRLTYVYGVARAHGATVEELKGK